MNAMRASLTATEPRDEQGEAYVHATAVAVGEAGLLIRGASGSGKSRLALALIAGAEHAVTFARLLGDDRIGLENHGGRLIARGHPRVRGLIEQRGQGIIELPSLSAAVVRLVVDLVPAAKAGPRYPDSSEDRIVLAGVELPRIALRQDVASSDLAQSILAQLRFRPPKPGEGERSMVEDSPLFACQSSRGLQNEQQICSNLRVDLR